MEALEEVANTVFNNLLHWFLHYVLSINCENTLLIA